MTPRARVLLLLVAPLTLACVERRDIADVAAAEAPFAALRGTNIATLRVGEVRAFRRNAVRAPWEGLRERVGDFDVVYEVPGYVGSDGSWPQEDVQVLDVEATREWPDDSSATAAWESAVQRIRNETGATPTCLRVDGPGFRLRVVEFDRGGGWRLAAAVAPETTLTNRKPLSARHSIAVRRSTFTERFPETGADNPDALPTWSRIDCPVP